MPEVVEVQASGRYQARYPGPDGRMRSAPQTFARKAEAERYLSLIEFSCPSNTEALAGHRS